MALLSHKLIFLLLFPSLLDIGDSIDAFYNIQLNSNTYRPQFIIGFMSDRKYFQKSCKKLLMTSHRNKASQY